MRMPASNQQQAVPEAFPDVFHREFRERLPSKTFNMPHTLFELNSMTDEQIRALAADLKIKKYKSLDRMDLGFAILDEEAKIASKVPDPETPARRRGRPRKSEEAKAADAAARKAGKSASGQQISVSFPRL